MTTATTTSEAGRTVAANALANRQRLAREEAEAKRADIKTPLGTTPPAFELEELPDPPKATAPAPSPRKFSLATTIDYRGRAITIHAEGMTLDQFCDLLDERNYAPPAPLALAAPIATADDLPDGFKLCQKHRAPMRPRNKQNDTWHSHNVGSADKPCWCKGYRGSDSPGYEVD